MKKETKLLWQLLDVISTAIFFLHVTWQQETGWLADRRSEVVRERPIRTQINTQPVKSAGKSIGEGFTKVQGLNNTPEITGCSAISPIK